MRVSFVKTQTERKIDWRRAVNFDLARRSEPGAAATGSRVSRAVHNVEVRPVAAAPGSVKGTTRRSQDFTSSNK